MVDAWRAEEVFRSLVDAAPEAMVVVDPGGRIAIVNDQAERLFGYSRQELIGRSVEVLVPEGVRRDHVAHRERYSADPCVRPAGMGLDLRARGKDGREFPVEVAIGPVETSGGPLLACVIRDDTDRRRTEEEASYYRAVIESSHDAIIGTDRDGVIRSWNAGAERLTGSGSSEMRGRRLTILAPAGQEDEMAAILRRAAAGEQLDDYETVLSRRDGTQVDVSLTVSPISDGQDRVIGVSTIARDITARLRYQEQLRFLAEHDPLTGAWNRRRFEAEISEQLGRARRYGETAAVLLIDLDRLKRINDTYGHRTGDRAIKAVGAALRTRLRQTDVVARVGGDEFAVLLPYANAEQGQVIADDLRRVIAECTIPVEGTVDLRVSATIGVSTIDRDSQSDEIVLAEADRSMYREKAKLARRAGEGPAEATPA